MFAIEAYGRPPALKNGAQAKAQTSPGRIATRHARDGIGYTVDRSGQQAVGVSGQSMITKPVAVHGILVGLTATPYYSLYLEFLKFRYAGTLSIWWPTVKAMQPEILRAWADRIRGGSA